MRYFLLIITFYLSLQAFQFKNGDIVYSYDSSDLVDISLKNFLNSDYTHSFIYYEGSFYGITIDYMGDRGKLDVVEPEDVMTYDNLLVLRPKNLDNKLRNCIKSNIEKNIDNILDRKIEFDWLYRNDNRNLFCSQFVSEPYKKCTENYILSVKDRFPFQKELNMKKFNIIYKKQ